VTHGFLSEGGVLHHGDCLQVLPELARAGLQVDLVFADPPFNLGKPYHGGVDDSKPWSAYEDWTRTWLSAAVALLKPGGAIFVYNMPRWCVTTAEHLLGLGLTFHNWIAVRETHGPPRKKGLYRAHYGLVYFTNGEPAVQRKLRTPIEKCRHCGGDVRDYGGYRDTLKEGGVSVSDIWTDISSVRHPKFKAIGFEGPQLSTRLLRRVLLMATNPGDLVLDPFAGSGTTAVVCEAEGRRWVGIELEASSCGVIARRLTTDPVAFHESTDWLAT
jgi:site-specific DNA-methyltransferase (adenine-specific)